VGVAAVFFSPIFYLFNKAMTKHDQQSKIDQHLAQTKSWTFQLFYKIFVGFMKNAK